MINAVLKQFASTNSNTEIDGNTDEGIQLRMLLMNVIQHDDPSCPEPEENRLSNFSGEVRQPEGGIGFETVSFNSTNEPYVKNTFSLTGQSGDGTSTTLTIQTKLAAAEPVRGAAVLP